MADPRFFDRQGPFTLGAILEATEARVAHGTDLNRRLEDVAPLSLADERHLAFLDNPKYTTAFRKSGAGACFVTEALAGEAPRHMVPLVSSAPYLAYARAAHLFYPSIGTAAPVSLASGNIHPSASIGEDCRISPLATIGPGAEIGNRTVIGDGARVGRGVVIGEAGVIHANVTISHAIVGVGVEILPGACIGQEGFGFAPNPPGYITVPQLGRVLIGDNVSIGANTTIDRGAGPDTVIGDDCRIDNLVQIAHNVTLGRGCVLAAQVGISGSTKIGDYVVMGGQVGLAGHLAVASGVTLAARTGVTREIRKPGTYAGFPAVPITEWRTQIAHAKRAAKKRKENDG